jgi:tetratricopeptide (TPR) repeat protein
MAVGVSATILLALLCGLWPGFRRTLGPFLLCHALLLAPMLGLTMNGDYVPFDRYCALAGGAWAVGLAVLVAGTPPRRRTLVAAALGAYLLALACRSEVQTWVWRSWDAVVADISANVAPDEFPNLQYYNPAQELKMSGQYDQARAVVARGRQALRDDPALVDLERDIEDCRATYTRFCPFADVHVHLGAWFIRSADWREADEHLRLALELSPGYGEAAYNRALVRLNLGDYPGALHDFLWAEAHVPAPLSAAQRQAVLGWVAREAEAAGNPGLAQAARRGSAPGGG